jgi:hypothetical protein
MTSESDINQGRLERIKAYIWATSCTFEEGARRVDYVLEGPEFDAEMMAAEERKMAAVERKRAEKRRRDKTFAICPFLAAVIMGVREMSEDTVDATPTDDPVKQKAELDEYFAHPTTEKDRHIAEVYYATAEEFSKAKTEKERETILEAATPEAGEEIPIDGTDEIPEVD